MKKTQGISEKIAGLGITILEELQKDKSEYEFSIRIRTAKGTEPKGYLVVINTSYERSEEFWISKKDFEYLRTRGVREDPAY